MSLFQADEQEQDAVLGVLMKSTSWLLAIGVVSRQSVAGIILRAKLADQKAYLEQSECINISQHKPTSNDNKCNTEKQFHWERQIFRISSIRVYEIQVLLSFSMRVI